ncbi:MAG: DUF2306 domain-containing protein [Mariniblastus sp.]
MKPVLKSIVFILAIFIAGNALLSLQGFAGQSPIFKQVLKALPWAGHTHIIAGSLALIFGGFQLSSRLRRKNLSIHKLIGNIYVTCVVVSTIGAIASLPYSQTSMAAKSGFWLLAIVWPVVTLAGYPWRNKFDFHWHGKLMTYSYALTCAAISLRLILVSLLSAGASFQVAYPIAAWGGGLVNVAIAFVILRCVDSSKKQMSAANANA